ncbi:MAG: CoA-binding domain protein [Bacteroidetes bacterium]|nr:CoA-binding domain protein [Bacteroidota bacterium]
MPFLESDDEVRILLLSSRVIAVVGLSDNLRRDSHGVARYLLNAGYTIIPVNPNIDNVFGVKSYPTLDHVPEKIDIVDIFRRAEFVPDVVESAIRVHARAVWMQLGVFHPGAADHADRAGLQVVVEQCMMVEHQRLVA